VAHVARTITISLKKMVPAAERAPPPVAL